jgi:hypothetical protein
MKDACLINCVFLFPCKNSLQLTIKYSDRAAKLMHTKSIYVNEGRFSMVDHWLYIKKDIVTTPAIKKWDNLIGDCTDGGNL